MPDYEEQLYRKEIDRKMDVLMEKQTNLETKLDVLTKDVRYNTKLLEQIIDLIPSKAPNKEMQNLLKVQMGALRPLFEKAQFDGKDQLLSMLDSLFGGKI